MMFAHRTNARCPPPQPSPASGGGRFRFRNAHSERRDSSPSARNDIDGPLARLHALDQIGGAELVTVLLVVRQNSIAERLGIRTRERDASILHLLLEQLFA